MAKPTQLPPDWVDKAVGISDEMLAHAEKQGWHPALVAFAMQKSLASMIFMAR